ncbi:MULTISPECIES: CHAD domain-containing protein [unclassified Coleofasciculus]|uniref:CHAD domain-containing protein n=1 Tax=unclassified Coleofasciculus TaxID=2692782 RepID=UPI00187F0F49|nr:MULTISPECIES: CHAD domain-containing protein [unclassified Coleofasciculus]MBE9129071.1 CHAD domain-containing protein [Coleofasciculus sp. LEGE 07081]MBE9152127.1 CHAD domain-containing protein [Coleofasciculus sp. LEGE 07092]
MPYQLNTHESVPSAIRRITCEQIDRAVNQLSGKTNNSQDEAVHNARKRFKKIRAVLRLVRDEIGQDIYKRENKCFRDVGHQLSDVRDAQVLVETLDDLTEHFSESVSADAFTEIRQILEANYHSVCKQVFEENDTVTSAIASIKAARERIESLPIERNDWLALRDGLHRVYKRGYKGFRHAIEQPTVENLHEWRKRVKYLWYHLRILKPIWSGLMAELADQTHDLADYLGDDHDLAVLRQWIGDHPELFQDSSELEALLGLSDRRRTQLQLAAKQLGQRIYTEETETFVSRIGAYWQAWQQEIEQPILAEV